MKKCLSCGNRVEDGVTECPVCLSTELIRICPNCSSPLEKDGCPVCGYLTDEAVARYKNRGSGYPVPKPLDRTPEKPYGDIAVSMSFLGLVTCLVIPCSIIGVIFAVMAWKYGDTTRKPLAALIMAAISVLTTILFVELFRPMLFHPILFCY